MHNSCPTVPTHRSIYVSCARLCQMLSQITGNTRPACIQAIQINHSPSHQSSVTAVKILEVLLIRCTIYTQHWPSIITFGTVRTVTALHRHRHNLTVMAGQSGWCRAGVLKATWIGCLPRQPTIVRHTDQVVRVVHTTLTRQ